jgi:hypothetical protein
MSGGYGRRGQPAQTLSRPFTASLRYRSNSLCDTTRDCHSRISLLCLTPATNDCTYSSAPMRERSSTVLEFLGLVAEPGQLRAQRLRVGLNAETSTFRLSATTVSMSLTGSRFSSESAPGPLYGASFVKKFGSATHVFLRQFLCSI